MYKIGDKVLVEGVIKEIDGTSQAYPYRVSTVAYGDQDIWPFIENIKPLPTRETITWDNIEG